MARLLAGTIVWRNTLAKMIPNKNIFCNSPWFELHIYWDGGLGFCCQEHHRLYEKNEYSKYNIKNMSIKEWMNSTPMKNTRQSMFQNDGLSICKTCYIEQEKSGTSRRHKCNQKSAIFTKNNFEESFDQSVHNQIFVDTYKNNGEIAGYPIDMHIDLGNYCNLACKMCGPLSSSKIASQYKKWEIKEVAHKEIKNKNNDINETVLTDWTRDSEVWNRFCNELLSFHNLHNVHFMGGETLLTKRFEDFLDFMIANNKTNFNMSFVTNGTIIDENIIHKLEKFSGRINIELSIETNTDHNSYIRQGTDTPQVIKNIKTYLELCKKNNWDFTIRPAIGLLSVGYYDTLLRFCLEEKLVVKALIVVFPEYLQIKNLPKRIKDDYKKKYTTLIKEYNLENEDHKTDFNESNKHEYKKIIKQNIDMVLSMLDEEQPADHEEKLKEMIVWLKRWDLVYNLKPHDLYPEFKEIFEKYQYE